MLKDPNNNKDQSLTQKVLQELRLSIIFGVARDESKLNIASLKKHYEIGGTPIREALNQLVAENFVELLPLKGFRVSGLSFADLQDIIENRLLIEKIMLHKLLKRKNDHWESELIVCMHRAKKMITQKEFVAKPNLSQWLLLSADIFFIMSHYCDSVWLARMQQQLYYHTMRYEYLLYSQQADVLAIIKACFRCFQQCISALLERDSKSAITIHTENLHNSLELMQALFLRVGRADE